MPSQSQTSGLQAETEARENLLYRVNVMLRQNVNRFRLMLRQNPQMFAQNANPTAQQQAILAHLQSNDPLSDEEYAALSTELVEQGTLLGIAPNQIPVPRPGQEDSNLAEMIEESEHINFDQIRGTPAFIRAAVTRNTGNLSMLRGATVSQAFRGFFKCIQEEGFFGAIGHLFSMLFGGGNNGNRAPNPLERCIASCTADDICNDLSRTLPPTMQGPQRAEVLASVRNGIMTRVGFPPPNQQPRVPLSQIQPTPFTSTETEQLQAALLNRMSSAESTVVLNLAAARAGLNANQAVALRNRITAVLTTAATQNITSQSAVQALLTEAISNDAAIGLGDLPVEKRNEILTGLVPQIATQFTSGGGTGGPSMTSQLGARIESGITGNASLNGLVNAAGVRTVMEGALGRVIAARGTSNASEMQSPDQLVAALVPAIVEEMSRATPPGVQSLMNTETWNGLSDADRAEINRNPQLFAQLLANNLIRPDSPEAEASMRQVGALLVSSRVNGFLDSDSGKQMLNLLSLAHGSGFTAEQNQALRQTVTDTFVDLQRRGITDDEEIRENIRRALDNRLEAMGLSEYAQRNPDGCHDLLTQMTTALQQQYSASLPGGTPVPAGASAEEQFRTRVAATINNFPNLPEQVNRPALITVLQNRLGPLISQTGPGGLRDMTQEQMVTALASSDRITDADINSFIQGDAQTLLNPALRTATRNLLANLLVRAGSPQAAQAEQEFLELLRTRLREETTTRVDALLAGNVGITARNGLALAMGRKQTPEEFAATRTMLTDTIATLVETNERNPALVEQAFLDVIYANQSSIGLSAITNETNRNELMLTMANRMAREFCRDRGLPLPAERAAPSMQAQIEHMLPPELNGKINAQFVATTIEGLIARQDNPICNMTPDQLRAAIALEFRTRLGGNASQHILTPAGRTAMGNAGCGAINDEPGVIADYIANMVVPGGPANTASNTALNNLLHEAARRRIYNQVVTQLPAALRGEVTNQMDQNLGVAIMDQVGFSRAGTGALATAFGFTPNSLQTSIIARHVAIASSDTLADPTFTMPLTILQSIGNTVPAMAPSAAQIALAGRADHAGGLHWNELTEAQQTAVLRARIYNQLSSNTGAINNAAGSIIGNPNHTFTSAELGQIADSASADMMRQLRTQRLGDALPGFLCPIDRQPEQVAAMMAVAVPVANAPVGAMPSNQAYTGTATRNIDSLPTPELRNAVTAALDAASDPNRHFVTMPLQGGATAVMVGTLNPQTQRFEVTQVVMPSGTAGVSALISDIRNVSTPASRTLTLTPGSSGLTLQVPANPNNLNRVRLGNILNLSSYGNISWGPVTAGPTTSASFAMAQPPQTINLRTRQANTILMTQGTYQSHFVNTVMTVDGQPQNVRVELGGSNIGNSFHVGQMIMTVNGQQRSITLPIGQPLVLSADNNGVVSFTGNNLTNLTGAMASYYNTQVSTNVTSQRATASQLMGVSNGYAPYVQGMPVNNLCQVTPRNGGINGCTSDFIRVDVTRTPELPAIGDIHQQGHIRLVGTPGSNAQGSTFHVTGIMMQQPDANGILREIEVPLVDASGNPVTTDIQLFNGTFHLGPSGMPDSHRVIINQSIIYHSNHPRDGRPVTVAMNGTRPEAGLSEGATNVCLGETMQLTPTGTLTPRPALGDSIAIS